MTTGTHDEGLGFDVEHKPEIKQYGVNDLSPVSETPVFTERMKWFAQQLKDHNVPEHIADAMMNPIHGNQAGSDAYVKAMEEIEKAEIEREAELKFKGNDIMLLDLKSGYVQGVVAERSRNINLAAQLLRAKQRVKELEIELETAIICIKDRMDRVDELQIRVNKLQTELFSNQSMQSE